jgi:hypothetical protein
MADARPLVDLDPKPLPVPPRPTIKSVEPGTLAGAGEAFSILLTVSVECCLPGPTVEMDGAALADGEANIDEETQRGGVRVMVPMAGLVVGRHLVTVTDGNGTSDAVQVFVARM